jgi:hypothetical protein
MEKIRKTYSEVYFQGKLFFKKRISKYLFKSKKGRLRYKKNLVGEKRNFHEK